MSINTRISPRTDDRLSYLWLVAAAACFAAAAGRWTVPLAAWLAPLFLLRFLRTQPVGRGLLLAWLVRCAVAGTITLRGTVLLSGIRYLVTVLALIGLAMLPYLADRLLAPRLQSFTQTLLFPTAATALEFTASAGPTGTMSSIAYSQYGNLPLMQLVSVTGIWGISFLIYWFGATVNWAWQHRFALPVIRFGLLGYAAVITAVLLGGGARVALASPESGQIRVAGLSASRQAVAAADSQLPPATLAALQSGTATTAQRATARGAFGILDDDLLSRSRQQATAGARLVLWPEASPVGGNVLQEDMPALIQRASDLARSTGSYLDLGLAVFRPTGGPGPFLRDASILIDPSGRVLWSYEKSHLVPFTEQGLVVRGNGQIPTAGSPLGRLATAICFDLDFPATIRQAGRAGTTLLLSPADDWRGIDPFHAHIATFRAVENGFSLVRESSNGLSISVDPEGRVLAASDYFQTNRQTMVVDVPAAGAHTLYTRIGDLFAWLCVLGALALIALGARGRPGTRIDTV